MAGIYRRASQVIVWLGDPDGYVGMEFMLEVTQQIMAGFRDYPRFRSSRSGVHAVNSVFQQPYWSRLWVVQEFALCRSLVVCYGRKRIEWDQLIRFYEATGNKFRLGRAGGLFELQQRMLDAKLLQAPSSLSDVCFGNFIHQQCADPRDRIYGLIGLLYDTSWIDIDYDKPANQVF